jgi:formate dehydrogenase (coenzyme F420) beta subunit
MDITKPLKEIAKEVLSRDDVACLIGYEKGSYGFRVAPCVLTSPEQVDRLVFSPLCVHNLTNYLTIENIGPLTKEEIGGGKIAIVVKGCDSKALTMLMAENGIDRDKLVVIGVCSPGVVDLKKLEKQFPQAVNIAEVQLCSSKFIITCEGETTEVPEDELLNAKCKRCKNNTPVIYDELVGEPDKEKEDNYSDVILAEGKSTEEKQEMWEEEFRLRPQFVRRSVNYQENLLFHVTRAFHLAGRCIECGECERACPQDIPLMELNRKLAKDVKELFDYGAGTDPEAKPLFATYNIKDPDEGIL